MKGGPHGLGLIANNQQERERDRGRDREGIEVETFEENVFILIFAKNY